MQPLRVKLLQLQHRYLLHVQPFIFAVLNSSHITAFLLLFQYVCFWRNLPALVSSSSSFADYLSVRRVRLLLRWIKLESVRERLKKLGHLNYSLQVTRCMLSFNANFLFDYTNILCACESLPYLCSPASSVRWTQAALSSSPCVTCLKVGMLSVYLNTS